MLIIFKRSLTEHPCGMQTFARKGEKQMRVLCAIVCLYHGSRIGLFNGFIPGYRFKLLE